jgi:hypothetical protein
VPNVVPPQISGSTSVGGVLTTWPGQWNPCSPPLVAVDVYWPSDGSHGTSHIVTAADQLVGRVCSESTVWDSSGDVGGPLTACADIPQPPPRSCVIDELQRPWVSGSTSAGATLSMNGGSWQPSCGGGLSQADIRWWPDESHSATYVVQASDVGTTVCGTVTVWDFNGATAHDDACIAIPGAPPPPPPPTDTTPPTVGVTAPAAGAVVLDPVDLVADATDDVGVAGVQFRIDGNAVGPEDTTAPYSVRWDIATSTAGGHSVTAVARDAAGNTTTSAPVDVTVSDGVTDGVGVVQSASDVKLPQEATCTSAASPTSDGASRADAPCGNDPTCLGPKWRLGHASVPPTPDKPPITYKNRITQLVYWQASAALDVCVDTGRDEIVGFSGARVTPLYSLVLVWSYDNAARWTFGPQGRGVKTSWAQVTDSYTGCLFKLPIGCNKVTFTIFWTFYGTGKYSYVVRFD